jgi:class 3 adenylate cyclase
VQPDFESLCNSLSMTEIVRLQTMLSSALARRFEQKLALVFSDVAGSTQYFSRFGDEAGRKLQQNHIDLVQRASAAAQGRIVDTAGDGAFLCFPDVDRAASAMVELLKLISSANANCAREHQLAVRIGIHFGPVLSDGAAVSGDSVNYCARVTASADAGEIRITREAFLALADVHFRLQCRNLPPVTLKGIDRPANLLRLDWRDHKLFPTCVQLETGEIIALPDQDIISFGRLKDRDGVPANDIVLRCRDEDETRKISRWHFELRRTSACLNIRVLTSAETTLNGQLLEKGTECQIRSGDCVRLGAVLSLYFESPSQAEDAQSSMQTVVTSTFLGAR